MVEKIEEIVKLQIEAIKNIQIDKVTVWDSGTGEGGDTSSTAGFLRGLIGSLPPVHELAEQAGVELPEFLFRFARAVRMHVCKTARVALMRTSQLKAIVQQGQLFKSYIKNRT